MRRPLTPANRRGTRVAFDSGMATKTTIVSSRAPASAALPAIARIALRARSLSELFGEPMSRRANGNEEKSSSATAELLREWRDVVAQDEDTLFARRLAWDGLTTAGVIAALDTPNPENDVGLPMWASRFCAVYGDSSAELARVFAALDVAGDRARTAGEPLPFEPLFLPLVADARARLARRIPDLDELAAAPALATLEHSLLKRLTHIGAAALRAVFSVRRALDAVGEIAAERSPVAAYERFVEEMCAGELFEFFVEYPVAARLCATVAEQWTDAYAELFARLRADRDAIAATFAGGTPLGPVTALRADLSDPHAGGRGVLILSWTHDVTVVYKPRALGIDATFGRLLQWLNARAEGLALRPLTVLERGSYGWIECATAGPCTPDGVTRYYERCGALLCLTYALNGTDFHFENLLAAGEQPVLLDLEMLLGPKFPLVEKLKTVDMIGDEAHRCALESVINVRMLPSVTARGNVAIETGALGDPMTGYDHLPVVDGRIVEPFAYVEQIAAGFARTYRALESGADALLAPGGVLTAMRCHPVRFILRNTSLYWSLLERCLHPRFLRSGAARSVQLDVLAKTFLRLDGRPAVWPALAQEIRDLDQMDVPLFVATASGLSIRSAAGVEVAHCLEASAHDEMVRRMRQLGAGDLERQLGLIRATFAASTARGLRVATVTTHAGNPPVEQSHLDDDALLDTARSIGARVWLASLGGSDGAASWIGARYYPVIRRYVAAPLPHTLLDGYGGLALFFASLARVTGASEDADRARAALLPMMNRVAELERMLALRRVFQPGIGCGIGSAAYVLASSARCLDDSGMLRAARRVAALMHAVAHRAQGVDVVSGTAGGILALLAVHDACGADEHLEAAVGYGRRLLDCRVSDPTTGLRVWAGDTGRIETGMAHGQTGICMALSRLAARSGHAEFVDAAAEAEAYERRVFEGERLGLREHERHSAWAHGATGVGLARLDAIATRNEPEARADLEASLGICQEFRNAGVDTLCCGAAARIELLSRAAEQLARPVLLHAAHDLARRVVERSIDRGGAFDTGWSERDGAAWQLGLFHGEAGIGLSFLRLASPERLPSPLLAIC